MSEAEENPCLSRESSASFGGSQSEPVKLNGLG